MLRITEIFQSINGEVTSHFQGSITTFVRLAGCNLRCPYCDAIFSQDPGAGQSVPIDDIVDQIGECSNVTITGGEPLLQATALTILLLRLIHKGKRVTIETNGTLPISLIPIHNHPVVSWVIDYKGMPTGGNFVWGNLSLDQVGSNDWVKFVVGSASELPSLMETLVTAHRKNPLVNIAISPVDVNLELAQEIIQYCIENDLWDVVLNLQIHKIISVR